MMQCVVTKTFTSPLEHIDVEYEQRNLFELTVGKLQKEHLRPGMEPRLLRFVLINNALRTLQCHMMKIEEPPLTLTEDQDEHSESFICNTFKDGGLSLSPQSPPTPIKVRTLGSLLSDLSPLVASTGVLESPEGSTDVERLVEGAESGPDEGGGESEGEGSEESHTEEVGYRSPLGKHADSESEEEDAGPAKKVCTENLDDHENRIQRSKSPSINGLVNGIHNGLDLLSPPPSQSAHSSSDTESEDESSTLSPIDFTKVDPSLYDYDPQQDPASNPIISPPSTMPLFTPSTTTPTTHSLTAASYVPTITIAEPTTPLPCISEQVTTTSSSPETPPSKSAQTESHKHSSVPPIDLSCKNSSKFSGSMEGIVSTQNGHLDETNTLTSSGKKLCCSQEGTSDNDFFDDLVSLLIT